ncbi:kinase-like protein [Penicillium brevicompactum]|uniref:Kinase-like protein n=1 Tax=Penicillium brevicompactum TaxID=5074 RepID=A0A9W9UL00_PENBR|nr:kinase-like protein [Penicillium brevicompactum]
MSESIPPESTSGHVPPPIIYSPDIMGTLDEDESSLSQWRRDLIMCSPIITSEEKLDRYRPGGYHPVLVGDTFKDGRYTIVNKLGFGGYSTVWLAWDKDQCRRVALKIMVSDVTDPIEIRSYEHLNKKASGNLSQYYIATMLDSFVHEGPNRSHHCLVSEFLGPSLDRFMREHEKHRYAKKLAMYNVGNIADMMHQVMEAVSFIHEAGMAHGDIQAGNIAFCLPDGFLQNGDLTDDFLGIPQEERVLSVDGKPRAEGVPPLMYGSAKWPGLFSLNFEGGPIDMRHRTLDIRLYDFGQSFFHGKEPEVLMQPRMMKAPEGILTDKFDYRVDLWSIGYLIKWLSLEEHWFLQQGRGMYEIAYSMRWFVEDIPEEWLPNLEELRLKHGARLITEEEYPRPWLEGTTAIDFVKTGLDTATDRLVLIIKALMRWLPSDRISLREVMVMVEELQTHWETAENDAIFWYGLFHKDDSDSDSESTSKKSAWNRLEEEGWSDERREAEPEEWKRVSDEASEKDWHEGRQRWVKTMRKHAKEQASELPSAHPFPRIQISPEEVERMLEFIRRDLPKPPPNDSACPKEPLQEPQNLGVGEFQQSETPNPKCECDPPQTEQQAEENPLECQQKQTRVEGTLLASQGTPTLPTLEKAESEPSSLGPSGLDLTQATILTSQLGLQPMEMTPDPVESHESNEYSQSTSSGSPKGPCSSPEQSESLPDSQTEEDSVLAELASRGDDAPKFQLAEDGLEVSEHQDQTPPASKAPENIDNSLPKANELSSGASEDLEVQQVEVERKRSWWATLLSPLWRPWKRFRRS